MENLNIVPALIGIDFFGLFSLYALQSIKNEALQSIKENFCWRKKELDGMFRVILFDDNRLTTYLLYRFTNTAAASQVK